MSSSSSPRSHTRRYQVFTSFYEPDVSETFVSHLRKQLSYNEISMFDDQGIERSHTLDPDSDLKQAIRESRISIVVLSKNYASSSWYLDELLEILKCKEETGQTVITISYGVHLSDVYKQTGEFGKVFKETCRHRTEEEKQRWSQALIDVASLKGYAFFNWYNESKMIEKIARDVSNELKGNTISKRKLQSLSDNELRLELEEQLLVNHNGKSRNRCSTGMAFLVVINLIMEIASAVADQLSSIRKPYFSRISLLLSILSVVLSIFDLNYKIRAHRARFQWKWMPMPWFYYSPFGENIIFGSFTDTTLLFCGVGQLIVSTVNCSYIERRREGPIKVSVWPLFFAICMLCSKFMEKPANPEEVLPITKMH